MGDIPRFKIANLNDRLLESGGEGDAFQHLTFETLLRDFPNLHLYPTSGKDGCIDLLSPEDVSTDVFECKVVGEDGLDAIQDTWEEVAAKLEKHLADPAGPTKGQAQYKPWYSTSPPFSHYHFCTTGRLANPNQRQTLQNEIKSFFVQLGQKHPHLKHLAAMQVHIRDWADFEKLLAQQLHLLYRWFPKARPPGLRPFNDAGPTGSSFQAWLSSDQLTYYSRDDHLATHPAPTGSSIRGEEQLLKQLGQNGTTGLIVTGGGGVGKTRLMVELATRARSAGWTVLRVTPIKPVDSVLQHAERLISKVPTLLLIDYVETQREFELLIETINDINETREVSLYYVACCRTSYYSNVQHTPSHQLVDLVSPESPADRAWLAQYRAKTVEHIIGASHVPDRDRAITAAQGVPVLAVFAAWLHAQGRDVDLRTLLDEQDFGKWALKRLRQSFRSNTADRDLATLLAFLPLPEQHIVHLDREKQERLDTLRKDGWVDLVDDEEGRYWSAAHDVLADRIILSYLADHPSLTMPFVDEAFSEAEKLEAIDSAIVAFQRIRERPELHDVPWSELISNAMNRNGAAWRRARLALVRSALVPSRQLVALMGGHEEIWAGAEADSDFRASFGWHLAKLGEGDFLSDSERAIIRNWLPRMIPLVRESNYLLSKALKIEPEIVAPAALKWTTEKPLLFQTHYLIRSWLLAGLPLKDVQEVTIAWSQRHPRVFNLSFVLAAWLRAGGNPEVVRNPVAIWLDQFGHSVDAGFVLSAWLRARGDISLIQATIIQWLSSHGTDPYASHVLVAWLDAGGEKSTVQAAVVQWLSSHGTAPYASHVLVAWLDAGGEKSIVQTAVVQWLSSHGAEPAANFVMRAWLGAGGEKSVVQPAVVQWLSSHGTTPHASHVLRPWLDAGGEKSVVQSAVVQWLLSFGTEPYASHVLVAWLDAGGEKSIVQSAVVQWLLSFGTEPYASHILVAWLDAGGEKSIVQTAVVQWLSSHGAEPAANFVMRAWLGAEGEKSVVQPAVVQWLSSHGTEPTADFVLKAWLDAGGKKSVVQSAVVQWLSSHGTEPAADFVLKAWLDAGGKKSVVQPAVVQWLSSHGTEPAASHVLAAWLDAGGEKSVVQAAVVQWLSVHAITSSTRYVVVAWLGPVAK